jgi:WD40 repeat protein
VDMKTRQTSTLPGSTGLFSPRWSPDGRYLLAISVEGSKKLLLYDFKTQKWSEWLSEASNVNYPHWSADSRYVYYDNFATGNPKWRRVKVGDNHPEDLFGLSGLRRYDGIWGSWSGVAPDGSALFVRDASTQEIYALDVEFP